MSTSMKKVLIIILVIALSVPALFALTKPGFFPTQDYIYVARIYQMDKPLKDGQFPVRWVPDFRYGEPLYNFYAPLAYYTGVAVHSLGFSYLNSTKILFALGFLLSAFSMYLLGKKLFGRLGGLLSATLYLYAPYHSVDVYVRGALSESWALVFFPLIFLTILNLKEKQSVKNCLLLALSLAGLFYTHNIMTMLFMPFAMGLMVFLLLQAKSIKLTGYYLLSLVWGVALAASFLLPAYLEKNFVQTDHLLVGYFNFRGHFVAWPQFFSTFWGYGASVWGTDDGMSFQVGVIHWALLALGALGVLFRKNSKRLLLSLVGFEFLFSLYMQHNRSAFIWESLPTLAYVQFPWRFLGISIFLASLMGGSLTAYSPMRFRWLASVILVIVVILTNMGYFHPESYYYDSQDSHYISEKILSQDDRLPKDYLPIWVKKIKAEKIETPVVLSGQAIVTDFQKGSDWGSFNVETQDLGLIEVPITYFPGWEVQINGQQAKLEQPGELGLIKFISPQGKNDILLKFKNTPIRLFGDILSLIAWIPIILLAFRYIRLNDLKQK